jgi:TonB family protein
MNNLMLILALLVSSTSLNASQSDGDHEEQQKKWPYFKGIVVDFVTRNPIAGAKAAIEGTKLEATTNAKGEFEFEGLTPGATSVLVTHPHYRPLLWRNIPITKDQAFYQFLTMKVGSQNDKPLVGQYYMGSSSAIDEDALPIQTREASYPLQALKDRVEGTVLLFVTVNEEGEVLYASVKDSAREDLNLAALDAAQYYKFKPARAKGKPVQATITIPFNFKLADRSTEFPINQNNGSLTNDDIVSALNYLGIQMYRFSYDVPFKHRVSYSLERYIDGKRLNFENTGYGATQPGKCNITLFKYIKADSVLFTLRLVTGGYVRVFNFSRYSVGGYPSSSWIPFPNLHIQSGKKVPICVYVLTQGALSVKPDEPLESIISKNNLVFVVSAELRLE